MSPQMPVRLYCIDFVITVPLSVGIILAACLQEILNATFITSSHLWNHTNNQTNGKTQIILQERFNVYGPVRLVPSLHTLPSSLLTTPIPQISQDVDNWYKEMKCRVWRLDDSSCVWGLAIPPDVISFHYVSQMEAILLYHLLDMSSKRAEAKRVPYILANNLLANRWYDDLPRLCDNSSMLLSLWPSGNAAVGHYSKGIANLHIASEIFCVLCQVVCSPGPLCGLRCDSHSPNSCYPPSLKAS
jgi:hypothetical protein